jgi:hypothetical protein
MLWQPSFEPTRHMSRGVEGMPDAGRYASGKPINASRRAT